MLPEGFACSAQQMIRVTNGIRHMPRDSRMDGKLKHAPPTHLTVCRRPLFQIAIRRITPDMWCSIPTSRLLFMWM